RLSLSIVVSHERLEIRFSRDALQSFPRNGLEDHPWVMSQIPEFWVQPLPDFVSGMIEGPAQVQSQLDEHVRTHGVGRTIAIFRIAHKGSSTRLACRSCSGAACKRFVNNCLSFRLHLPQVGLPEEAFGIDFVNVFGSGRASGEPSILG